MRSRKSWVSLGVFTIRRRIWPLIRGSICKPLSKPSSGADGWFVLVDTGPLVALYALHDRAHRTVATYLRESRCSLLTTWPVLTEAWHLLPSEGRLSLMHWLGRGGVQALEFDDGASGELIGMLEKYRDLPMDLADASLVLLAHKTGISDILTLDRRDFLTYRLPGNKRFHLVLDA